MEQTVVSEKKKFHLSAPVVMLIIAAVALLIGFIAPPIIKKNENKRISQDCKTASNILAATETALKDSNVSQQVTTAGYATLTWIAAGGTGTITCTNNITDLQSAVTSNAGDISRKSKTLGTAVWTVTVYPNSDGSGFTVNGAWSGAIGGDDTELTKESGGTVAE